MRGRAILPGAPDLDLHQRVVSGVLNYHVHDRGGATAESRDILGDAGPSYLVVENWHEYDQDADLAAHRCGCRAGCSDRGRKSVRLPLVRSTRDVVDRSWIFGWRSAKGRVGACEPAHGNERAGETESR